MKGIWRTKWFAIVLFIIILVPLGFLVALKIDFGEREDAFLKYFSQQQGIPETFAKLEEVAPQGSMVLCWWDYGRAVREWSHREVIEAYPSRDIWYSIGSSRDVLHNLEAQIFGRWGSSEKIHDIARMFMLPENQSLEVMRNYRVTHVLIFTPDELQKFTWIAHITGYNATDYLTSHDDTYDPTPLGSQVTLLRLLFDERENMHPEHFTKLYDNGKGIIYKVVYPVIV